MDKWQKERETRVSIENRLFDSFVNDFPEKSKVYLTYIYGGRERTDLTNIKVLCTKWGYIYLYDILGAAVYQASAEWDSTKGFSYENLKNSRKVTKKHINTIINEIKEHNDEMITRLETDGLYHCDIVYTPQNIIHAMIDKLIEERKIFTWLYVPTAEEKENKNKYMNHCMAGTYMILAKVSEQEKPIVLGLGLSGVGFSPDYSNSVSEFFERKPEMLNIGLERIWVISGSGSFPAFYEIDMSVEPIGSAFLKESEDPVDFWTVFDGNLRPELEKPVLLQKEG